jgi:putative ATP-dependent endonuclease of OLD family
MIRIDKVEVENFRSCKSLEVQLSAFTPLVGYNNAGKSNIMDAIRWVLHHGALNESDFWDPSQCVMVTAYVEGIDNQVLSALSKTRRKRIEKFVRDDGHFRFRRYQAEPEGTKGNIELEACRFQANEGEEKEWEENPTGLNKTIQTLFPEPIEVGAMEDAGADIGKSKRSSTIGRLIKEVMQPSSDEIREQLQSPLKNLKRRLEAEGDDRLQVLEKFDTDVSGTVDEFFPGLEVRAHIPIPNTEDLFGDGTIRVVEELSGEPRDVSSMGHGAQRSIQMALVHHLAERSYSQDESEVCKLVLVDEPELYLHPQAIETVRKSLKDLSQRHYQVVFATHSPLMIGEGDIPYTNVVGKSTSSGTKVRKRVAEAVEEVVEDKPSQQKMLFNLQNASRILFSDSVLLIEGKAEMRLIPRIYEEVSCSTIKEDQIAIVGVSGASSIPNCFDILSAMGMSVMALVDLDFVFLRAIQADLIDETNKYMQKI